jgi:Flp pilus assembly protein TadB
LVDAGLIAVIMGSFSGSYKRRQRRIFEDRQLSRAHIDLQKSEIQLARTGELDLAALWKVTQQRLDYYHEIATQQARQSFRNAQVAMALGLLILITSAIFVVAAKNTAASIVSGAIGISGATLASYIGRTFIRAQETTASHLRSYFSQPLQFSRYLAAERLLDSVDGEAKIILAEKMAEAIIRGSD